MCRGMGEPAVIRQFIRVIADGNHRGPGNHAGVEAGRGLSKNREVLQDGRISVSVLRAMPDASVLVFDASLRFVLVGGEALARQGFSPERTPESRRHSPRPTRRCISIKCTSMKVAI